MNLEKLLTHAEFVKALARSLVTDEHRAADVIQETWLAALRHPPARETSLRSWLGQIVINCSRIMFRSESRRSKREHTSADMLQSSAPDDIVAKVELRQRLVEMVLNLEEPYRSAILFRFYEDLSLQEVADRLGMPRSTVRLRIQQGLELLRERLDREFSVGRAYWIALLAPVAEFKPELPVAAMAGAHAEITSLAMTFKTCFAVLLVVGTGLSLFFMLDTLRKPFDPSIYPSSPFEEAGRQTLTEDASITQFHASERMTLKPAISKKAITGQVLARVDSRVIDAASVEVTPISPSMKADSITGITDASGRFHFPSSLNEEMEISHLVVRIFASGFRNLESVLSRRAGSDEWDCGCFYLHKNETYAVKVNDKNGHPVQGARVRFYKENKSNLLQEKFSDAEGLVKITDNELNRISGRRRSEDICLCVSADGLGDAFYRCYNRFCTFLLPTEITLDTRMIWTGHVMDAEGGHMIHGAQVTIVPSGFWERLINPVHVRTDFSGRFHIPVFTFTNGVEFKIIVEAEGYMPFCYKPFSDPFNPFLSQGVEDPVALEKAHTTKRIRLLDGGTGRPLKNFRFCFSPITDVEVMAVTDGEGIFDCPMRDKKTCLIVDVPGFERFYLYEAEPDLDGFEGNSCNNVWELSLKPLVPVIMRLIDPFGEPVSGASVHLCCVEGNDRTASSLSDEKGQVRIHPNLPRRTQVNVQIEHPDFNPFCSESLFLADLQGKTFELTEWAELIQNIRVVDDGGEPFEGLFVFVRLFDESGTAILDNCSSLLHGPTDSQGYCNLILPAFERCVLNVVESTNIGLIDRTDIHTSISKQDILDQKEIVLHFRHVPYENFVVQGEVRDEYGRPLEDVYMHVTPMNGVASDINNWDSDPSFMIVTASNGYFCFIAGRDITYGLTFAVHPGFGPQGGPQWFTAEKRDHVKAGDLLYVTMKSWPCRVVVEMKGCVLSEGDELLFETKDGQRFHAQDSVRVEERILHNGLPYSKTEYFGIPSTSMRAVVVLNSSRRFASRFFSVEQGKSVETSIEAVE